MIMMITMMMEMMMMVSQCLDIDTIVPKGLQALAKASLSSLFEFAKSYSPVASELVKQY